MPIRRKLPLLLTVSLLGMPGTAMACPFCKVAGGDLGNELNTIVDRAVSTTQPETTQPTEAAEKFPIRFGFAADVTTAYFRHGYMHQDRGTILQPTVSLSLQPFESGDWTITPYVVWFNSIHSRKSPGYAGGHGAHTRVEQQYQQYLDEPHEGTPYPHYHFGLVDVITFEKAGGGWFESEVKPGIVFTSGPLVVDVNLMGSFYPTDFHDMMIEVSARASYDLASLWDDREQRPFALRLQQVVSHELRDDNGDEETIFETSLEPAYRFQTGDYFTSLSMPVTVGWSSNGYFQDTNTDDETFGFVSAGLKATVELPSKPGDPRLFINADVTWYHLLADSAIFANGGDENAVVGTIGFGIAF